MMRRLAIMMLFLFSPFTIPLFGQNNYAFFYFEGDQQTPIYVKVEGQMQPRYGKNHFIIPNLGEGYTQFEILFQENEYPPQKFWLDVPENGFRGFVVKKVNDNQFALYDLQQKKYIIAGNKKGEDVAPDFETFSQQPNVTVPQKFKNRKTRTYSDELPLLSGDTSFKLTESPARKGSSIKTDSAHKDVFINGIVLNGSGNNTQSNFDSNDDQPQSTGGNGDCPNPMSNETFENFALLFINQSGDDDKLNFLRKELNDHCFSTEQVRILTKNLNDQSARYEATKMLYNHTSDRGNYKKLESLFNTPYLKKMFLEIRKQ